MAASKRFVCIHGHFYQPPRENPWLETVETQDTAAPYHDWNERVCAECYAPNGAARIVNSKNKITRIVNNYAAVRRMQNTATLFTENDGQIAKVIQQMAFAVCGEPVVEEKKKKGFSLFRRAVAS